MKEVWDKLNQEMSRAKKASEPQHLANDIEGKEAWVSREARRLNELEADILYRSVETFRWRYKNWKLAKKTGCVGAGNQGNEPIMQELEKRELLFLRELVAANMPSNLEAPGLDGSERSRKWHELREIQESIGRDLERGRNGTTLSVTSWNTAGVSESGLSCFISHSGEMHPLARGVFAGNLQTSRKPGDPRRSCGVHAKSPSTESVPGSSCFGESRLGGRHGDLRFWCTLGGCESVVARRVDHQRAPAACTTERYVL